MKKFTLRLNKTIYTELKQKADFLGLTLSSVVKINLYTTKSKNFKIVNLDNKESIRMTLTIPDEFYNDMLNKTQNLNTSMNAFINSALYFFLNN